MRTTGDLWLYNNQLTSLPDSFSNIRVGRSLGLYGNQLTSLPPNFARIEVGGYLFLNYDGSDIGPAMAEASALEYPNVGNVYK